MKGERKLTKGRAVFIIIACAALLAAIVLICSGPSGSSLDTAEERAEYLASLGWKADPGERTAPRGSPARGVFGLDRPI